MPVTISRAALTSLKNATSRMSPVSEECMSTAGLLPPGRTTRRNTFRPGSCSVNLILLNKSLQVSVGVSSLVGHPKSIEPVDEFLCRLSGFLCSRGLSGVTRAEITCTF